MSAKTKSGQAWCLALSSLAWILGFPVAAAATECTQQCWPTDADVNPGAPLTTGVVREILYAHGPGAHVSTCSLLLGVPAPAGPEPTCARTARDGLGLNAIGPELEAFIRSGSLDESGRENYGGVARSLLLSEDEDAVGYVYVGARSSGNQSAPALLQAVDSRIEILEGGRWQPLADGIREFSPPLLLEAGVVEEVKVPMVLLQRLWPPLASIQWSVELREANQSAAPLPRAPWDIHAGHRFPTRLILPVLNPLLVEENNWTRTGSGVTFSYGVISPFGNLDLNQSSLTIDVDGVAAESVSPAQVSFGHGHGAVYRPARINWTATIDGDEAAKGLRVRLSVLNAQGNYLLVRTDTILPDGATDPERVPLFPWASAWAMAAVVLALRSFRGRGVRCGVMLPADP